MNSKIKNIKAYEILDSRGLPTIMTEVILNSGTKASATVPSGASTGSKEALELCDQDQSRYFGKGKIKAVDIIENKIAKVLIGTDIKDIFEIDKKMLALDGVIKKTSLGANTILAVSLACLKVAALQNNKELFQQINPKQEDWKIPVPMLNILNGGSHSNNNIGIQEFMIAPIGAKNFAQAIQMGVEIFQNLKIIIDKKGFSTAVGDEGGFAPNLDNSEQALELILEAIAKSGYKAGEQIYLALDVAASEIYKNQLYYLDNEKLTSEELIAKFALWVKKYPIYSIEDGMDENDIIGWQKLTLKLGNKIQLIGDDLFVTQTKYLQQGIDNNYANAILIKPNQVGSISETLETIELAKKSNFANIISHRSGETEDTSIADLAVATGAGQIKTGAPCRGERVAKYNRLLYIEQNYNIPYFGKSVIQN